MGFLARGANVGVSRKHPSVEPAASPVPQSGRRLARRLRVFNYSPNFMRQRWYECFLVHNLACGFCSLSDENLGKPPDTARDGNIYLLYSSRHPHSRTPLAQPKPPPPPTPVTPPLTCVPDPTHPSPTLHRPPPQPTPKTSYCPSYACPTRRHPRKS